MFWTLDTCGFDDLENPSKPQNSRNCRIELTRDFNFITFVRMCPAHQHLPNDVTGFTQVRQENQRGKSNTFSEILDGAPTSMYDTLSDGSRDFKRGINVSWSWNGVTPSRVLTINISGVSLSQKQQNDIRNRLNNRFGIGNVVITFG